MPGGRKPKPAHLKLVEDNPGKRPLPERKVKLSSKIRMPNGMSDDAKRVWRYTVSHLPAGMAKDIDVIALRIYCESVVEYDLAGKKLAAGYLTKTASGSARPSPWHKIRNDAFQRIYKMSSEFGFTPSSRTKLGILDVPADEYDDDELL